jgi:hypothetical protein
MGLLTKLSGQITVTTAGTAVQGSAVKGTLFQIQALPGNTGVTYFGNDGADDVSATTGFPLPSAGPGVVLEIGDLSDLWFDAATSGDKVAWIRLAA